jgi:hypothetical protein
MARSIPARKSSPVPPAARNGGVDALDVDAAILRGLDAVRYLDELAGRDIGIGKGTMLDEPRHRYPIILTDVAFQLKSRPDIGAAFAAGRADEAGLDVGEAEIIGPAVAADRNRVTATIVRAIDQDAARPCRASRRK